MGAGRCARSEEHDHRTDWTSEDDGPGVAKPGFTGRVDGPGLFISGWGDTEVVNTAPPTYIAVSRLLR